MTHTDINNDNWLMEFVPRQYRDYALLARLDRPIGVWLLLLPAWWGIVLSSRGITGMGFGEWCLMLLFAIGAILMRAAGCIINDLWDRDIDQSVERTRERPLASGALSIPQALVFLCVLLLLGFCILLILSPTAILLGMLVVPMIIIYPLMKRYTDWPQAFLGLTFNMSAMMGWAATADHLSWASTTLYLSAVFWTMAYDTVYAYQDVEDDAVIGVRSTALKFGDNGKKWVTGFMAVSVFLLAVSVFSKAELLYVLPLIPAFIFGFYSYTRWDPSDPSSSLKTFRSSKIYGLLVLAALFLVGVL